MTDPYPVPPSLAALIAEAGGSYGAITPAQWQAYDKAMADWHRTRRIITAGAVFEAKPK